MSYFTPLFESVYFFKDNTVFKESITTVIIIGFVTIYCKLNLSSINQKFFFFLI